MLFRCKPILLSIIIRITICRNIMRAFSGIFIHSISIISTGNSLNMLITICFYLWAFGNINTFLVLCWSYIMSQCIMSTPQCTTNCRHSVYSTQQTGYDTTMSGNSVIFIYLHHSTGCS